MTLLPALLGCFGTRVLRRRERRALIAGMASPIVEPRAWARWASVVRRRPALLAALATALLAVVSIPMLSMRVGSADAGTDPAGSTTRLAYDLLAKGFGPGYNGPLQLVAQVRGAAEEAQFARVERAVAAMPGVKSTSRIRILAPARPGQPALAVADVEPKGSPQDASTSALLHTVRDAVIPSAERGSAVHVLVGGQTAVFDDFSAVISSKLPVFVAIVVSLSFLLLMVVFRSLVPLVAAVMNVLSAAAAFGGVTAIFQDGVGSSLPESTGPDRSTRSCR